MRFLQSAAADLSKRKIAAAAAAVVFVSAKVQCQSAAAAAGAAAFSSPPPPPHLRQTDAAMCALSSLIYGWRPEYRQNGTWTTVGRGAGDMVRHASTESNSWIWIGNPINDLFLD